MIRLGGSAAKDEGEGGSHFTLGSGGGEQIQVAAQAPAAAPAPVGTAGNELFVRHARKDGRLVAVLRAVDHGTSCIVETEVYPHGSNQLTRPGPYTFSDAHQASAFVTEAVAALMYLGCDIQAE